MYYHNLVKNEMLYIPMGYVAVESVPSSLRLVYGIRRSLMIKGARSNEAYDKVKSLFVASKRNTSRMDEISAILGA